jgi:hypothetical protein
MGPERRDRVLVAVVAETRAWEVTAESFFANVLDPLDADLALCVGDHESPNPMHERARFVWRTKEPKSWREEYDRKTGGSDWRVLLKPGAQLLGGIEGSDELGSGAIVQYFRQFLKESIEREGIAEGYDWLVVTRSDLLWPVPHPSTRYLSARHIYALDGEGYTGLCDRHLVVPRRYVRRALEVPDPIFSDPRSLKRQLDRIGLAQDWPVFNPERFLAARFRALGLLRRVRYLPYVPYLVRAPGNRTRWSPGHLDEERGFYVKYPAERERSRIARRFVNDQPSWERYLSPIRGARWRSKLRAAYRERGLFERPFPLRELPRRTARRLGGLVPSARPRLHRISTGVGSVLRRIPGAPPLLDWRIRRIRRRAERRADTRT